MRKSRCRGLLIPSTGPLVHDLVDSSSIWFLEVYEEVKGYLMYRNVRLGAFAPLYFEGYREYNVAFLHPIEVLDILNGRVVSVSLREHPLDDIKVYEVSSLLKRFRSSNEVLSFLTRLWKESVFITFSPYIAEALIHNLTEVCRSEMGVEMICYCYGRVEKVLRKIYPEELIKMSELIGDFRGGDVDPEVVVDGIWDTLFYRLPRWPWGCYGLVIDKSRRTISVLNPEVMQYIPVNDVEELRLVEYVPEGYGGNPIPILVVKKIEIENPHRKLEKYVEYMMRPDLRTPPTKYTLMEGLLRRIRRMNEIEWFGTELTTKNDIDDQGFSPRETQEAVKILFSRVFDAYLRHAFSKKRRGKRKDEDSPV
uniref:Uncharacterized protein n=1 Tax=Ignisphaera aggregans TaxID=334771 RepID=A0A7J3Z7F0_9CREN